MYKTVIVPLDGSPFAAQALSTAAALARRSGAALLLTRVHEAYAYEETDYSISDSHSRADQEEYLADIAEFVESKFGIRAEHRLLSGGVVPALCDFANGLKQPLVVISTHGRTGFSRFWLGSVADGIARHAGTPVLMLRHHAAERGLGAPAHSFRSILVPLDGSDGAETAIPPAVALAGAYGSRLILLRVVVPVHVPASLYAVPFAIPPEPIADTLDSRVDEAQGYLDATAAGLRGRNATLDVATSVRVSDSMARAVIESAGSPAADTIALATHGRGISRLLAPSVTDKVLRGGPEAVLVVRAPATT